MKFENIPKDGTTHGRKAFWDAALAAVLGQRKNAGRNIAVNEHYGYGTFISVPGQGSGSGSGSGSGCHGVSTLNVHATFSFDDTVHVFAGAVDSDTMDISDCSGSAGGITLVTVTEAGIPCVPDAEVGIAVIVIYDSMSGLWAVDAVVEMEANATTCGPSSWPGFGIGSSFSDNIPGVTNTFPLVVDPSHPMPGNITFTFS